MHYLDASALVKRYVRERGTAVVRRVLAGGPIATSRLSEVEVASGLARRAREGTMPAVDRDRLLAALAEDLPAIAVVELTPEVSAAARRLLLAHPLRAGDAIQLASALYLQRQLAHPIGFLAFDERLNEAARAVGLEPRT